MASNFLAITELVVDVASHIERSQVTLRAFKVNILLSGRTYDEGSLASYMKLVV